MLTAHDLPVRRLQHALITYILGDLYSVSYFQEILTHSQGYSAVCRMPGTCFNRLGVQRLPLPASKKLLKAEKLN